MLKILALCCIFAAISVSAFASYPGDVLVGDDVVIRVRFAAGGLSVSERAEIISERVRNLLGEDEFLPYDVRVSMIGSDYVITAFDPIKDQNVLIVTVDERTAEHNGCTQEQLANMWAENLRREVPQAKAIPGGL